MLKRFFVAITLGICLTGFSITTVGCGGGPGEIQKGKATNKDYGKGVGEVDGQKAPEGTAVAD